MLIVSEHCIDTEYFSGPKTGGLGDIGPTPYPNRPTGGLRLQEGCMTVDLYRGQVQIGEVNGGRTSILKPKVDGSVLFCMPYGTEINPADSCSQLEVWSTGLG